MSFFNKGDLVKVVFQHGAEGNATRQKFGKTGKFIAPGIDEQFAQVEFKDGPMTVYTDCLEKVNTIQNEAQG